jgi:hypothetical protein
MLCYVMLFYLIILKIYYEQDIIILQLIIKREGKMWIIKAKYNPILIVY